MRNPSAESKIVEDPVAPRNPTRPWTKNDFYRFDGPGSADAWGKGVPSRELVHSRPYDGGTIVAWKASRWVHPQGSTGYPGEAKRTGPPHAAFERDRPRRGRRGRNGARPVSGTMSGYRSRDVPDRESPNRKTGHPVGAASPSGVVVGGRELHGRVGSTWPTDLLAYRSGGQCMPRGRLPVGRSRKWLTNMGKGFQAAFPSGTTMEIQEGPWRADNPQTAPPSP